MIYPKEFIKKCKEIYPEWLRLHDFLDGGSEVVGRYLNDASCDVIGVDEILESESIEQLKIKAKLIREKQNLYKEWREIYNS